MKAEINDAEQKILRTARLFKYLLDFIDTYKKHTHRVRDSHMNKAVHYRWAQLVHNLYHGFIIILEENTISYFKKVSSNVRRVMAGI